MGLYMICSERPWSRGCGRFACTALVFIVCPRVGALGTAFISMLLYAVSTRVCRGHLYVSSGTGMAAFGSV